MKIVIPDQIELAEKQVEKLKEFKDIEIHDDHPQSEEELIQRLKGAEIVTANWVDITENIIKNVPTLKYIIVPAVGYEWVDVGAASRAGVLVINCPTYNSHAVAEHTIALMFAIARKIIEANIDLKSGKWNPPKYTGSELHGKKLLLVGYGNIGRVVGHLAMALGMHISFANSRSSQQEIDDLISKADFISLHLPLTEKTRHFIDRRRFDRMKSSAYLINTARGGVVDQQVLFEVLTERRIAGAAVDVFEHEPPLKGKPNDQIHALISLDNVVATPHIGYKTLEANLRLGEELIKNIRTCVSGRPINVVNR